MAAFSSGQPIDTTTAAEIAAWVDLTHTAMLAVGCVQTDDTGQLVEQDIPEPANNTTYNLGYRVYELNDALSGNSPLFIRIEFHLSRIASHAASFAFPRTAVSVGFETNGAGTIIGAATEPLSSWLPSGTVASVVRGVNPAPLTAVCKNDGYLGVAIGVGCLGAPGNRSITPALFAIWRGWNAAGEISGDSVVLVSSHGDPLVSSHPEACHQWAFKSPPSQSQIMRGTFFAPANYSIDGMLAATPAVVFNGARPLYCPDLVCVPIAAVTQGQIIPLSLDDFNDRTYVVIPSSTNSTDVLGKACWIPDSRYRYQYAIAMRFE